MVQHVLQWYVATRFRISEKSKAKTFFLFNTQGFIADKDYCSQIISHHQIFSQDPVIANLSYEFDCPHVTKVVWDPNAGILFASCSDGTILKVIEFISF